MSPRALSLICVLLTVSALASCGLVRTDRPEAPSGGSAAFPRQVVNCGHDVTVAEQPRHVVALGPSEVTIIAAAGGVGVLVARNDSGARSDPYPDDLQAAVAGVPQLGAGGGEVTRESLIDLDTDLAVGSVTESLSPESLQSVGIPMLSLRGNCGSEHAPGTGDGTADFDDVYADITTIGELLGTQDVAATTVQGMRARVATARAAADLSGVDAAAVIVARGSLRAYGTSSMAHTQLSELGVRNVFDDVESRVFDASIEQLVERDPRVIVLLSYDESDQQALEEFLRIPGAVTLDAVVNDTVLVQPYELSSQGALSIDGLEKMATDMADVVG